MAGTPLPRAPTVGRPAHGFTPARAQRWVLGAAILVAITYAFRRVIEPGVSSAPARGSQTAKLLGAGSPPPPLGQWAIAYGAGFLMLSVISLGAPEIGASLAMLLAAGNILSNGTSIIADIAGLEGANASSSTMPAKSSGPAAAAGASVGASIGRATKTGQAGAAGSTAGAAIGAP